MAVQFKVHDINVQARTLELEYIASDYSDYAVSVAREFVEDMGHAVATAPEYPKGIRLVLPNLGNSMLYGDDAPSNLMAYVADIWKLLYSRVKQMIQSGAIDPATYEGNTYTLPED